MVKLADYPALSDARARLADEWRAANPSTSTEVAAFYRSATELGPDLDAWHQTAERRLVTDIILHVTRESEARVVLDIGCGAGHDLLALQADNPQLHLFGVEPNAHLRARLDHTGITVAPSLYTSPLATADVLVCIDVLEHVPEPEAYLEQIAAQAKVGAFLIESMPQDDDTPLHLKANRAWHPGRCLERNGWWVVDKADRLRVWERKTETDSQHQSILACIYRSMSPATHNAILDVLQRNPTWRERLRSGDGLIARSRSILASQWWAETSDDVFLMIDDDVTFTRADAERLVDLCRDGHDIICGAYPVHNGEHFAIRGLPNRDHIEFGTGGPVEIQYAATGFMAVHRKVIDALIKTLPLCQPWSFYPLFQAMVVDDEVTGDNLHVSEDWGFCEMARKLGFKVWLDPLAILDHTSQIPVSVRNMDLIKAAVEALAPVPVQEVPTNGRS